MASSDASGAYFIQLEEIISSKSAAGELWQLDNACGADSSVILRRCVPELPTDKWKAVSFDKDCVQRCFSKVTAVDFHLLLKVKEFGTRLDAFRNQGLLQWAATLSSGSRVGVRVRNENGQNVSLTGCVRFAGCLKSDSSGLYFGIELEPEYAQKGTSNGVFKKHRYFECNEDCGVFVSVDKLAQLHSPNLNHSDSTYFSDQSSSSSAEVLDTRSSVADVVKTCSLAINDRIVWLSDGGPERGTVRWIGVLPGALPPRDASQLTVGVEFDNPVGSGTGLYRGQPIFSARRHHASLVPIMGLMKESDLYGSTSSQQLSSLVCTDSETTVVVNDRSCTRIVTADVHCLPDVVKQNDSPQSEIPIIQLDNTISVSSVDRKGCVLPPSVAGADLLCGVNRGIQCYSDTCTLEAIVFVLFAFYSYFDKQLFAKPTDTLAGAVKTVLVEQIVNPLRATYFVSRDKMHRFGDLFTMIQSAKLAGCAVSTVTLSDNPSGTITTVLCDLIQVDPLIMLTNSTSYVYTVDVSPTSYAFPSLQHVMECCVVKNPNRRLLQYPQSVFIVSVDATRLSKLIPCGRIFPGLTLDISGILQFAVNLCRDCGRQGMCICGSCFTADNMHDVTDIYRLCDYVFCEKCFDRVHLPNNKHDHQPIPVAAVANSSLQKLREMSQFELFAVVSLINGRYVSFVKVGAGDTSAWLSYDAMAALGRSSGDSTQVFLPEIKCCNEIETWLKDIPASQRTDSLPDIIVKLTSGLHLCFYQPRRL